MVVPDGSPEFGASAGFATTDTAPPESTGLGLTFPSKSAAGMLTFVPAALQAKVNVDVSAPAVPDVRLTTAADATVMMPATGRAAMRRRNLPPRFDGCISSSHVDPVSIKRVA
jgi:hypothetical protein